VGAVGLAAGCLSGDGHDLRLGVGDIDGLSLPTIEGHLSFGKDGGIDEEALLLQGVSNHLARYANALLITCGGRMLDLPLLRYRFFARRVALTALHLPLGNRLKYFDRFDQNWHVDVSDVLSGHGATRPLSLEDLCGLLGVRSTSSDHTIAKQAAREAAWVFLLFVNMLHVMGRLSSSECSRAEDALQNGISIANGEEAYDCRRVARRSNQPHKYVCRKQVKCEQCAEGPLTDSSHSSDIPSRRTGKRPAGRIRIVE
jgi:hypothetical protein